ncbi:hypothetical protein [Aeromonas intestinalis]
MAAKGLPFFMGKSHRRVRAAFGLARRVCLLRARIAVTVAASIAWMATFGPGNLGEEMKCILFSSFGHLI